MALEPEETEQEQQNPFQPYQYKDPVSVNYWKKKCKCKADGFIYANTITGKAIWTDETEDGPICKNCMKAWKLVICYPEGN